MRALRAEVAEMRNQIQVMNDILQSLNHDIRSGSERSLPLFMGYAERLRLDADTAVGATQVIDRQIAQLQQRLDQLSVPNQG
jgi:prefoldin subunit 5